MTASTSSTRVTATDLVAALATLGVTVEGFGPAAEAKPESTRAKKAREKREQAAKEVKAAEALARKEAFFGSIHDPQNKADNAALAAWCREKGLIPNGEVWKKVKDGCADLAVLKPLDAANRVQMAERKAARKS